MEYNQLLSRKLSMHGKISLVYDDILVCYKIRCMAYILMKSMNVRYEYILMYEPYLVIHIFLSYWKKLSLFKNYLIIKTIGLLD